MKKHLVFWIGDLVRIRASFIQMLSQSEPASACRIRVARVTSTGYGDGSVRPTYVFVVVARVVEEEAREAFYALRTPYDDPVGPEYPRDIGHYLVWSPEGLIVLGANVMELVQSASDV